MIERQVGRARKVSCDREPSKLSFVIKDDILRTQGGQVKTVWHVHPSQVPGPCEDAGLYQKRYIERGS